METLERIAASGLRLSAHICSAYSDAIMAGEVPELPISLDAFTRAQINHAKPKVEPILNFGASSGLRCIGQSRGVHFPEYDRIDWLFDCSGGNGKAPAQWAEHTGASRFVGFTGGIRPENISSVLAKVSDDGPYLESGVRTENWLDLDKVETICNAVYR